MTRPTLVPPLKCQGIKTKLVSTIQKITDDRPYSRWVEPFCGSCVVPLNIQPKHALLCDSNAHIIHLYQDIKSKRITPSLTRAYLTEEGEHLKSRGEEHYYHVRNRFNESPSSLDFLFLNRSCFNGVIRFNRNGKFNVPYGHKSERFAPAYVTKITNQVQHISRVLTGVDWTFEVRDFRDTLADLSANDFVYADPPYAGRHVDYFNSWSDQDESDLATCLSSLPCDFVLSTWHSNEFRTNAAIENIWTRDRFNLITREHYYHVGSSESLRHPMLEAFITNFQVRTEEDYRPNETQPYLFEHEAST